MNSEKIKVYDTRVSELAQCVTETGRHYAVVTVAMEHMQFQPGQFMMVKTCDAEVRWGFPYLIQRADEGSFTVLAPRDSDLYRQLPGSEIAVWGPRGTAALAAEEPFVLVAEEATYDRILPLAINHAQQCRLLLMVGGGEQNGIRLLDEQVSVAYLNDVESICVALEGMEDERIVAALNPAGMKVFCGFATAGIRARTRMFVPTKIGCGIGACTGCVIHTPDSPVGIRICEEGPFLPLERIDLETDMHCLTTRV